MLPRLISISNQAINQASGVFFQGIVLLTCCSFLVSCSLYQRTAADLPKTFLSGIDLSAKIDNLPFQHSAVFHRPSPGSYTGVLIKPIHFDTLPKDAWRASASSFMTSQQEYFEEAENIAKLFRAKLIDAIRFTRGRSWELVDAPGPRTVTVEIALTELVFSHPVARGAALIAPIPGTGPALSAISDPHVSFALRISDSSTGMLIATVADRRFPPTRVVDLNKLTVTSSAREVVGLWSKDLAETLASSGKEKIEKKRFALFSLW